VPQGKAVAPDALQFPRVAGQACEPFFQLLLRVGAAWNALRNRLSEARRSCSGLQAMLPSAARCETRESSRGGERPHGAEQLRIRVIRALLRVLQDAGDRQAPTSCCFSMADRASPAFPEPSDARAPKTSAGTAAR